MFTHSIQDILTKRLQVLPQIITGKNFRHDWHELVSAHIHRGKLALIDDVDTALALGDTLHRALKDRYECTHITLPRGVTANDEALAEIESRAGMADMLLAIGSGTVSDLVKYASFKAGKPYLLFPTAASMNGYVSANASIAINGHKQSLAAALPKAVFADMGIICSAPIRLAQAGLGDSLARPTAQADWLLFHHLLGVAYDKIVYDIMSDYEAMIFEQPRAILHRDPEVTETLFALILLSGFGMTIAKSSQPASGGEHMIAHAYASSCGAQSASAGSTTLHGEEISVTTLLASHHIEKLLRSHPRPSPTDWPRAAMEQYFDEKNIENFQKLFAKKRALIHERFPNGEIPKTQWEATQEAISAIHIPHARIASIIQQSGLPAQAEQIGWDKNALNEIIPLTRFTRDRFSWLDLA